MPKALLTALRKYTKERELQMNEKTVKDLRTQTGMTQRQFASYFGVSLRSLQGWEAGKRPPQGMVAMTSRIIELENKQKE